MTAEVSPVETTTWRIEGLGAEAAEASLREQLDLFGRFVGDWEITEWRNQEADGRWTTGRGEIHWRWILDGRAVQDVWSVVDEATARAVPLGTTIRFYDPSIEAWQSVWISPTNHAVRTFIGREVGGEIVLEGKNRQGTPLRWIFFDMRPDSFRWRQEELRSPTSDWVISEEMRVRRR